MKERLIYIIAVLVLHPFWGYSESYPEVIFENSLVSGSYAKSEVSYSGDSWVENVNKRLLVSDSIFFTPGNALSLKYISASNGNWRADILNSKSQNPYRFQSGDQLSFFIYVGSNNTDLGDLPKIYVVQRNGLSDTLSIEKYISSYKPNQWMQVKIPCAAFSTLRNDAAVSAVGFTQNKASDKLHQLYIDQVEFLPSKYAEARLTSAAILTEAVPYDRAVHLKWQLPLSPSIRFVKLYRSTNGVDFKPVGIRPIPMQSCLDIVPKTGGRYWYKIAWLDYNYKESPSSIVKEVQTSDLSDDAVLKLIQAAHINYFVENFDINSGMYMPYKSLDKAVVSTKESAGAVLSLLIGAERGQIPKPIVLQRISKIAYFLLRAQNRHGIYPAYFDGRKGLPEYRNGVAGYDVRATAALIEALLVAREYFKGDQEEEKDLRARITTLYDQINWKAIANEHSLLHAQLSLTDNDDELSKNTVLPISGTNEAINVYLLATSSKNNSLPDSVYFDAVYNEYGFSDVMEADEFIPFNLADSLNIPVYHNFSKPTISIDSLSKKSKLVPVKKYAVNLPFGELSGSLLNLYKPFMTINPQLIADSVVNWGGTLKAYADYVKRRDNEVGGGASNGDVWGFYQLNDSTQNYRINPAISAATIISNRQSGTDALISLYQQYAPILFTEYGFRSWLDLYNKEEADSYYAMNQAAIAVMIENANTGFIWKLYEEIPELKKGREKLFAKVPLLLD